MDSLERRTHAATDAAPGPRANTPVAHSRKRMAGRRRTAAASLLLAGLAACAAAMLPPASALASGTAAGGGANTLQNTGLTPKSPIPLVAVRSGDAQSASRLPVVAVPFLSAVQMAKPAHTPATVLAPVPANAAHRLAAYLFPVNQWDWVYLIGPRGLRGRAELANDGGVAVTLRNSHASLELMTPGGSPLMAQGMAGQFFPAAGEALNRAQPGAKWTREDLLQHATIAYHNRHRLALFAFRSQNGRSVYGYSFYQPSYIGAFAWASEFVCAASGTDAGLAPWIMASSLAALTGIGEPQLSGTPVPAPLTGVFAGGRSYRLPVPRGFSTQGMVLPTAAGVAWIGQPAWIDTGTGMRADIPAAPFSINLSPPGTKTLTYPADARQLATVAPYKLGAFTNAPWYTSVSLMQTAGPDWLLYSATYAATGMNQPAGNSLYAINLRTGSASPEHIASFLDAGGMFFSLGTHGPYVAYDQSTDLDPKGTILHSIWLVDLNTGKRVHLPPSALHGSTVTTVIGGRRVRIAMSPY